MSNFRHIIEILKLSATPPNIVHPIPLLAFLVFSQSSHDVKKLMLAIVFSSIFYAGVNLWNHVNDVEEDILAGKRNVLIENRRVRKATAILVVFLYLTSFLLVFFESKEGLIPFLICAVVTWIYSDKIVFGRFIRRWKEHYITELLTFIIAVPTFTLTLWSMFEKITIRAFALSITLTFLALSGTFLKDIKDTTGDELAGLKTLAVVFSPSKLLKFSVAMLWLYYLSILIFILLKIYDNLALLALLPLPLLAYSTIDYSKNNWKISPKVVKPVRMMISSTVISLIMFIVSGLLSRSWSMFQIR